MNTILELLFGWLRRIGTPPALPPVPVSLPPKTNWYLTNQDIVNVRRLYPAYKRAVDTVKSGQPPLALATIHWQENALETVMKGGEAVCGPFAYDPGGMADLAERVGLGALTVRKKYGIKNGDVDLNTDFDLAALVAADEFKGKIRGTLVTNGEVNMDVLADAAWGYNGRSASHTATGEPHDINNLPSWKYSPYVSNNPHAGTMLRVKGTIPDGQGGRKHVDFISEEPGFLAVYQELRLRLPELA